MRTNSKVVRSNFLVQRILINFGLNFTSNGIFFTGQKNETVGFLKQNRFSFLRSFGTKDGHKQV